MKMEKVMTNIEYTVTKSKIRAEYDYVYILDDEIVVGPVCVGAVNSNSYSKLREAIKVIKYPSTYYSGVVIRNQENKYYQNEYALECDGTLEDIIYELKGDDGIEAFAFYHGELIGHLILDKETQNFTFTSNLANSWWG